jgi:hypothetical protein
MLSNPSMVNFSEKKNQHIIKKQIVEHIKVTNEELFKKAQTELKGIPYPLAMYARKYFGTIQEFNKFNWAKSFLEADIIVIPEIEIVDYGKKTKTPKKLGD